MDDTIQIGSTSRTSATGEAQARMVTVEEAARILGIAKNTLDKARVYGGANAIPYAKLGKRVLYSTLDLTTHLKARTITNTCQTPGI